MDRWLRLNQLGGLRAFLLDRAGPTAVIAALLGAAAAFALSVLFDAYLDERRARDALRGQLFDVIENVTRIGLWPLEEDDRLDGARRAHIDLYTEAAAALAVFERRAPLEGVPLDGQRKEVLHAVDAFLDGMVRKAVADRARPYRDEGGVELSRFRGIFDEFIPHRDAILVSAMPDRIAFRQYLASSASGAVAAIVAGAALFVTGLLLGLAWGPWVKGSTLPNGEEPDG